MNKILTIAFVLFFILQLKAQYWEVTEIGQLPEPISNNAVCEGTVVDIPYLYSFGGIDTTKLYSGINLKSFRVNTLTGASETLPSLPDTLGKIAAGANRINDTIYIIGGYHVFNNGNELSSDKVHRFNTVTNTFMTDGASIPVATDDHVQAVWRDSLIYVITGWSNTTNIPDVQIYNPYYDNWQAGTSTPNNNTYKSFGASGTIIGDTIYYFGGASSGFGFNAQNKLRKGIIDPNNPTNIIWDFLALDNQIKGYRMACTSIGNQIHWIGGSNVTYNYDGIAYNGSGGVSPNNRDLYLNTDQSLAWTTNFTQNYPMDLRGIASFNDSLKYIAGGMLANQKVTDKVYRLKWNYTITNIVDNQNSDKIILYPNPVKQGDLLTIKTKNFTNLYYNFFNLNGELIQEGESKIINTKNLSKGIYILKVQLGREILTQKVTIR